MLDNTQVCMYIEHVVGGAIASRTRNRPPALANGDDLTSVFTTDQQKEGRRNYGEGTMCANNVLNIRPNNKTFFSFSIPTVRVLIYCCFSHEIC